MAEQKAEVLALKKENLTWESKFNALRDTHSEFKKEVGLRRCSTKA